MSEEKIIFTQSVIKPGKLTVFQTEIKNPIGIIKYQQKRILIQAEQILKLKQRIKELESQGTHKRREKF